MRGPRYREGPGQVNGEGRGRPIGARRGRLKLVGREMLDILTSSSSVFIRSGRISTIVPFGGRCTRAGVRFLCASRPL